jgi:Nitroreductase family
MTDLQPLPHVADDFEQSETLPGDVMGIVELPAPDLQRNGSLMMALATRASTREFEPGPLPAWMIGEILWAAFGVNRMITGARTAPWRNDIHDIDIYAIFPGGIYRYDALAHRLILRRSGDARALTGSQGFVKVAPLNLVYVVLNREALADQPDHVPTPALVTAGCIAQNVSLYCSTTGLASVISGTFNQTLLAGALNLGFGEVPVLAQSVGLPAGFPRATSVR